MKGSIMRSAFGQFCAESKKRAERTFHPLSRSVQKSAVELDGVVRLWVEETAGLWSAESIGAGQAVSCYDHVAEELVWRHLDVFEHRCEIRCHLPRGQRTTDGKIYRVTPPWEGLAKHFTQGFEAMVMLLLRQMPMAVVARRVGETDTRLWRLLHAHVAAAWPRSTGAGSSAWAATS